MSSTPDPERAAIQLDRRDIGTFAAGGERRQGLAGFEPHYTDIVDYIIRCTHRIWEDKAIGLIYTHYAHNTPVHLTDAEHYGRDQVVENTVQTLAMFPDLRLFGDEVIWNGNDEDGFHSSHRVTWVGHHTGHGLYGAPTGARVQRREIAHCVVRHNRIVEEWVVHDETALIRQLGLDEVELARAFAQAEAARGVRPYADAGGEVPRRRGQLHPPITLDGDPRDPDVLPHLLFGLIWNARMLNYIGEYYAEGATVCAPGNRRLSGHGDLTAYLLGLLAAFPDAAITVDHVNWVGADDAGFKVAARWTLQGTHTGAGVYGPPSGRRARVIGISHFEVQGGRIQREYMVWDEFALLKQIHWPA